MFHNSNADAPSNPGNIVIREKVYGDVMSNVTLVWMTPPAERVDNYNVKVKLLHAETATYSQEFQVVMATIQLEGLPYNQEITVSVSAKNCFAEGGVGNISFTICKSHVPNNNLYA